MSNKLLIIGASGHGKVIADIANKTKDWDYIAFLDDNIKKNVMNLEIIGDYKRAIKLSTDFYVCVAIGNNTIRKKISRELENAGVRFAKLIHPSAQIAEEVIIDEGTVIMANVVINSGTYIGKHSIINTGATIDHDCSIADFVHVSPGVNVGGTVQIRNNSWIGIGSVIKNNITIINNCIIGAGSVVLKDLNETGVYVGIPAKKKD